MKVIDPRTTSAGASLNRVLERVEAAAGRITTPRVDLPDGTGCFAHILDTEGNRLGAGARRRFSRRAGQNPGRLVPPQPGRLPRQPALRAGTTRKRTCFYPEFRPLARACRR